MDSLGRCKCPLWTLNWWTEGRGGVRGVGPGHKTFVFGGFCGFLGGGESKDLLRLRRPLILRSSDSKDKWRPMGPSVDEGIRFEKIRQFTSLTAKLSADELVKRTRKMSAREEYIRSLLTPGNDDEWRQIPSLEGVRRTTTPKKLLFSMRLCACARAESRERGRKRKSLVQWRRMHALYMLTRLGAPL